MIGSVGSWQCEFKVVTFCTANSKIHLIPFDKKLACPTGKTKFSMASCLLKFDKAIEKSPNNAMRRTIFWVKKLKRHVHKQYPISGTVYGHMDIIPMI